MSLALIDVLVVVRAIIEDLGLAVVGPKSHVLCSQFRNKNAHHGRSWPLLTIVVAVITLGVIAMKAENVVELAPVRGRLAPDVFLLKPCFWYAKFGP